MRSVWSMRNALRDAAVTASSQAASLPLSKAIESEHVGTVWRSLERGVTVDATFNVSERLRVFGLFGTSLTANARLRLELSNEAVGMGDVLDSRILAGGPYVADDDVPYEADDEAPYEADFVIDLDGNVEPGFWQWVYVLPVSLDARYMRLTIEDATNHFSFLDFGLVWAGDGFETALNLANGDGPGTDDASTGRRTVGGQTVILKGERVRFYRGYYDFLPDMQAFGELREMTRVGSKRNVLFVPDPTSRWINREAVLGLIQKNPRLPMTAFETSGFDFEIRERK